MDAAALKQKILELVAGRPHLATFATIAEGKPWARLVMAWSEGLAFRFTTSLASRKVMQIQAVPDAHLVLMVRGPDRPMGPYVQVAGKARVITDPEVKKAAWNENLKAYFQGPNDPNYCIIHLDPERIELMEMGSMEPRILEL